MTDVSRPNDAKTKELILYISERCAEDASFGATKLNKTLYFSDFLAYGNFGASITGQRYFKLPHGPAPRRLLPIQAEMERDGDIEVVELPRYAFRQKRIVPKRQAKLDEFSAEEIALVNEVIEALGPHSAVSASELSHSMIGWQIVDDREDIPYETVFLSPETPDEEHIARAQSLAAEHGWLPAQGATA